MMPTPAMPHTAMPLEWSQTGDPFVDYCLWEYPPAADPAGKLRSVNLLNQSLADAGMIPAFRDVMAAIQAAFGAFRTVWGIKQENGRISWEFYFYDYARQGRSRSITRLLEVIRPWVACELSVGDTRDYFMFSIDLDRELLTGQRAMDDLQMYIGNVGSTVSSGICYEVKKQSITMKNFYFFFDARTQSREIVDKVCSSAYLDLAHFDIDSVLWPDLRQCQTIVVANKRHHDGVYFSRITIDQLVYFLRRMKFPDSQIAFAQGHRSRLDHLLYDVGIDYRMHDGRLEILKSAYYGVF